jgi:16S rRNA processing protein RimM
MAGGGRICLGQIGAAHGVRGEVRLRSFTADPTAITSYGPLETEDGRIFEIESLRPAKDYFVATLSGVADRNAAERLANIKLYVPRARLPEPDEPDEFYYADLIGLAVVDRAGKQLGAVIAVHNFGAGDLLEVRPSAGGVTELVPFNAMTVPEIDIAAGRLVVELPKVDKEMPPPLRGKPAAKRSKSK